MSFTSLTATEIAERARPGQFIAVQMPDDRDYILPRHFSIHQASRRGGEDRKAHLSGVDAFAPSWSRVSCSGAVGRLGSAACSRCRYALAVRC